MTNHPDEATNPPFDDGSTYNSGNDFLAAEGFLPSPFEDFDTVLNEDEPLAIIARETRQLAVVSPFDAAPETVPLVIVGSGVSMGNPFIKRRRRPLSMRLTIVAVLICLLVTGFVSAVPLGETSSGPITGLQLLSGSLVVNKTESYHWYITRAGDDLPSVAEKFNVQVGGIIELNNLPVGQELAIGKAYKIPDDPFYGENYRPVNPYPVTGNGSTTFGNDWWNSYAGFPLPEQPCAPNGGSNPRGYHFQSPNWGSAWVRGFSWYHNGVDIAAANGNPIRAAQAGVVVWAGWTNLGFGWSVVISHCYYLSTLYGHMQALRVKAGQFVTAGQIVGLEGMTGWATGPHLHFSVLVHNQFVDPMAYFTSIYALTHEP